ncbi:MAG: S8 family serine peptidase [Chitinispirillaceae bacterium]|nr:S8 family serine peptidase [Chitinispirillaceae bacterium]
MKNRMPINIPGLLALLLFSTALANTQHCKYVEGRLLGKFKPGITFKADITPKNTGNPTLDSLNDTYRCSKLEPLIPRTKHDDVNNPLLQTYVFTFKTTKTIERLTAAYMATDLFEYVEPDYITRGCSSEEAWFPNDQYFNRQWALHNDASFDMGGAYTPKDDADIDMPEAWELEQGDRTIIIAILDSGCKMDHPELAGRLWKNQGEIPDNGIDDDDNGYVDDVNGWDFVNDDNDPSDDNGHGTAMAGTIGANTNNAIGFAGVNLNASIMVLKILDSIKTGSTQTSLKGIEYAIKMGAKVLNISYTGDENIQTENDLIKYVDEKNVVAIAGTGNKNIEKIGYPAAYDEVIAIGATGPDDKRYELSDTSGSNYGQEIDIVAPGMFIFYLDEIDENKYGLNSSGTSHSTAYTTGVVSLLLAKNPTLTPAQIKEILHQSAEDQVGDPSEDTKGWDKYFGYGRLNAYNALKLASGVTTPQRLRRITLAKPQTSLTFTNTLPKDGMRYYTLAGRMAAAAAAPGRVHVTPGLYVHRPQE